MPPLALEFRQRVTQGEALAQAGDLAVTDRNAHRMGWYAARVELLYELAYLRMFIAWESFLEQTFLRYLCGYSSIQGNAFGRVSGAFYATLQDSEAAVLSGQSYVLWHNAQTVINRAKQFLVQCPHEVVIASQMARLFDLAAVRHRIAHGQEHARQRFDTATMNVAGRRYRGARPGRFLRDWNHSTNPPERWLITLGIEFGNLAQQIG